MSSSIFEPPPSLTGTCAVLNDIDLLPPDNYTIWGSTGGTVDFEGQPERVLERLVDRIKELYGSLMDNTTDPNLLDENNQRSALWRTKCGHAIEMVAADESKQIPGHLNPSYLALAICHCLRNANLKSIDINTLRGIVRGLFPYAQS
jgi:hypothetical protein